jgi:hypothetical protein
MRGDLHLVMALAGLCAGCAYDGSGGYSQPNQLYGYAPGDMPTGEYYGYAPSYSPYGYAPQYYQPAPPLGLGFGVFGGGGHREHEREEEWREHHDDRGGERHHGLERDEGHQGGFDPAPAVANVPPAATAHMPPPAFRSAPPQVAQRPPPQAAANARVSDRPGSRQNPHP